jgi:addiction module RelE/StbE family toxin
MKVVWTDEALEDLKLIYEYLSRDSDVYALRQVERILGHEENIGKFPKAGRLVPEYHNEMIREVFEGNYRIIYRIVSEKRVDVLTVVHGAREL